MFGFLKKKKHSFPADAEGRRDTILSIHRYVSNDDEVKDQETIDLLIDLISDEPSPFMMSAYVLYYLGNYKPFVNGNEVTAVRISDMILGDGGVIPDTNSANSFYYNACSNTYSVEEIAEWESACAEKLMH